jgi:hypothetical protein
VLAQAQTQAAQAQLLGSLQQAEVQHALRALQQRARLVLLHKAPVRVPERARAVPQELLAAGVVLVPAGAAEGRKVPQRQPCGDDGAVAEA